MKRPITAKEAEDLRASFTQKIAETKLNDINYEQYLIACILTAAGARITQNDVAEALSSAEKIIKTIASHQLTNYNFVEVEVSNG